MTATASTPLAPGHTEDDGCYRLTGSSAEDLPRIAEHYGLPPFMPRLQPLEFHEPDEGHDCVWDLLGNQLHGSIGSLLTPPRTTVLLRCRICQMFLTTELAGHWRQSDLNR